MTDPPVAVSIHQLRRERLVAPQENQAGAVEAHRGSRLAVCGVLGKPELERAAIVFVHIAKVTGEMPKSLKLQPCICAIFCFRECCCNLEPPIKPTPVLARHCPMWLPRV